MPYFVVTSEQGSGWDPARAMREQAGWSEHATFINGLLGRGFLIAGGPLGGSPTYRALLIVSAQDEPAVRAEFAQDPWIRGSVLRVARVDPWQILASDDRLDRVLAELTAPRP